MVQYKLYYFKNTRSVCEATRMAFHYSGTDYEEHGIEREEWPTVKKSMPFGHVPVLEVDGKQLCESGAIARFVGKKFGLMGKGDWEEAKVNEAIDYFKDVYKDFSSYLYTVVGFMEGDKVGGENNLCLIGVLIFRTRRNGLWQKVAADTHFPKLLQMMKENGNTGFIVGSDVTMADFFISDFLFTLLKMAPDLFENYGELKDYIDRIQSLPKLKDYIQKRPESVF
ncbi:Glutathione S-transferase protein [Aphelenchoides besseyi]|nr:Glutathione S-transferase protein [Aphelenchoides besseyi]